LDDAVDVSDAAERLATASAARIFHLALPAAAALLMLALLALRVAYGGRRNWGSTKSLGIWRFPKKRR
jgi:hypothetical protein